MIKDKRKPQIVSLFTGLGALDLGMEHAGLEVSLAVEMNQAAVQTIRKNRSWNVIGEDLGELAGERLCGEVQHRAVDLLTAGPPCQPFSKAAYGMKGDTDRMDDPRASTLSGLLRSIRLLQPRAVLIENVAGLSYSGKSEGMEFLCRGIHTINSETGSRYEFSVSRLNAADYGVPQSRKRLFLVAARDGRPFHFPSPTHGDGLLPFSSAWDAIGDLDTADLHPNLEPTGKWAALLPTIPEGQNYLWHTERGMGTPLFKWRSRYWNFLLKLAKERPSWTIVADPGPATGPFHWKSRKLSIRELCRLQTIPDDFTAVGSERECRRQVGNAVPPALSAMLGVAIGSQLLGYTSPTDHLALTHRQRLHLPAPERPAAVPSQCLVE